MTISSDEAFAQLVLLFEDKSDQELHEALMCTKGSLEDAIDLLLEATGPSDLENPIVLVSDNDADDSGKSKPSSPCKRNPFDVLKRQSKVPANALQKGQRVRRLSGNAIEKALPCQLFVDFLPSDLADALLEKMMKESQDWRVRRFSLFERGESLTLGVAWCQMLKFRWLKTSSRRIPQAFTWTKRGSPQILWCRMRTSLIGRESQATHRQIVRSLRNSLSPVTSLNITFNQNSPNGPSTS